MFVFGCPLCYSSVSIYENSPPNCAMLLQRRFLFRTSDSFHTRYKGQNGLCLNKAPIKKSEQGYAVAHTPRGTSQNDFANDVPDLSAEGPIPHAINRETQRECIVTFVKRTQEITETHQRKPEHRGVSSILFSTVGGKLLLIGPLCLFCF